MTLGLWFLVTVGGVANPGMGEPRRCLLAHYRSLAPTALAAVKELSDCYEEETLSWRLQNCSLRLRRAPPRPASCEGLRQVARDLADAQWVLSSQRRPKPLPGTGRVLQLLAAAGLEVAACLELVQPGWSRKSLRPPRRHHKARRDDSPQCREASTIFSLLRLLSRDLRLVANSGALRLTALRCSRIKASLLTFSNLLPSQQLQPLPEAALPLEQPVEGEPSPPSQAPALAGPPQGC
ncbi:interferon lambda-4-like [Tenrec ecaudatus]|uniref:interferon lambda-4-like n=1 Tax=Tenrec ecaudatus TaxID=94439 RepID=UPI003F5A21DC